MSAKSTVTVTVPALSSNLTTLGTWLDDYQITNQDGSIDHSQDAFLLRTIARCSEAVERYCDRRFAAETVVETIYSERDPYPYQTPGGLNPLQLAKWPLIAVSSVVQQDAGTSTPLIQFPSNDPTAPADYVVKPKTGQLIRLDSFGEQMAWPAVVFVVTYQAGYVLPVDPWVAGWPYLPGALVSSNGNTYQTAQGGVSGATSPAGAGSVSDGEVMWECLGPTQAPTLPSDLQDAVGRLVYTRYVERKRDPFIRSQAVAGGGTTSYWAGAGLGEGNLSADIAEILAAYRVPVVA